MLQPSSFARWIVGLASLAAAATIGRSLPQEGPKPLPTDLVERIGVHLVQVAIIATDRQGNPVTDLKAEDIAVKDRGERRNLAYLEPLRPRPPSGDLPAVRLLVDAPGGWAGPVPSDGRGAEYLIFFIDVENDPRLGVEEAQRELLEHAAQDLDPSARVAVVSYDGTLHQELPFTHDREALGGAIQRALSRSGRPSVDLTARIRRLLSHVEDCVLSGGAMGPAIGGERCLRDVLNDYREETRPRSKEFLGALKDTIRFASGLRGRKAIVAVSHGVDVDPMPVLVEALRAILGNTDQVARLQLDIGFGDESRHLMDEVIRFALDRNIAIHFLDRSQAPTGDFGASRSFPLQPGAQPMRAAFVAAQSDMEELAASTGGFFVASVDVGAGLKKIVGAQAGAYEVGFYVDQVPDSDRLHKVKVTSKRKGVYLHHRRAYPATPVSGSLPLKGEIVLGPPAAPGEGGRGSRHSFDIEVDPKSLGYRETGNEVTADFTLHFIVQDLQGRVLADSYHFLNHAYPLDIWKKGAAAPVRIHGWVELDPGAYTLTAVFRNLDDEREGELQNAIEVLPGGER